MASKFKEIPKQERPREKFINSGWSSLSDQELLAVVLKSGTKDLDVLDLAGSIIKKYYNFNNLLNCKYEELITIKGIKQAKAIEILAIMEIAKRMQKSKVEERLIINSPEDIYNSFSIFIENEVQENFMVIFLNIKSYVIRYEKLFIGGTNFSIIDVNLILKKSIEYGACKIICLHNHPSGDPTPSNQDVMITKKIDMNAQILDIKLLDHIIVGKNKFVSLKKDGFF